MAADVTVPRIAHFATAVTAKEVALSDKVQTVTVTNRDGTNTLYAKVKGGQNAANVLAAAEGDPATVAGNDNFVIPPNTTVKVHEAGIPEYVAVSVIASAGTPACSVTGTLWEQH